MTYRKKLIEVALPLEDINRESAREKSIRHGHPSTLHLWWARRPLAAARAVIFASLVDDPSSVPEEFPTEAKQEAERQRLFELIRELVLWENTTNERVLGRARAEISRSWARWCKQSGEDPAKLPPFHDPFAGGGALPLEAQRLGLEAHASDLNPVAVTINKAMIEIPPRFAGRPPVNPDARKNIGGKDGWKGVAGMAEDVRFYGEWMRQDAEKRIGKFYPKVNLPDGSPGTVIAWLWARTVESPDPAFRGCQVPLVSSFWLSNKPGKLAWVYPEIDGKEFRFEMRTGTPKDPEMVDNGTKLGRGANFRCLLSNSPISPDYIKKEGMAGRMGARLLAIVAEGDRGRAYLSPNDEHENIAQKAKPKWKPEQELPNDPRNFWTVNYGLTHYGDLFTARQLVALTTFSDMSAEVRQKIQADSILAGMGKENISLRDGGSGAVAYAEAISVYLAFTVDKCADYWSSICSWHNSRELVRNTFGRQAIPMTWDYCECNPFSDSTGNWIAMLEWVCKCLPLFSTGSKGSAIQASATSSTLSNKIISSDPPYYDNIGYADLSDFFYIWLRRSLQSVYPDLFGTLMVPKSEELIATPYRHADKHAAETFFLDGMTKAIHSMAENAHAAFPVTIYYAFKQSESGEGGISSTGWETFLEAVLRAGFSLTGTWPMRTELGNRMISSGTNALASSIVLVCRPRPADAPMSTSNEFKKALRKEMPPALRHLQAGNIAPVDLAQASIGPGMGIFSRYSKIMGFDGKQLGVHEALTLINQTLDEVLAEQEGDFDSETGWSVAWFDQFGFNEGPYGEAETLSKARNTALNALVSAGVVKSSAGKVRLLRVDELPKDWDPLTDKHLTVWEMVHHLIRMLATGESAAADLLAKLGSAGETARELAYRLFNICERRKRSQEAQAYNGLVISWPEILRLASSQKESKPAQGKLL